ncbi:MAG TPA: glutamine synthetase, partial [Burkholderiaceae bacterium]|nr:glutamine synthetase [Burkholderiaceae bacterium]
MAIRDNFSHADLERWFDANHVDEVECLVPDLTGVARGKILPRTRFTQDRGMRLAESVLGMTVTGEAPES